MTDELENEKRLDPPGPMLKHAREQAGLSTQQVAQRLNLRHSVVVGLEQDTFEPGMSITYIRGYMRNYARLVGLDEQRLNEALDAVHQPEVTKPMQSFSGRTHREKHDSRWMMLSWLLGFGLVGVILWGLFGRTESLETPPADETQVQTPEIIDEAPVAVQLPEVEPELSQAAPESEAPLVDDASTAPLPEQDEPAVSEPKPEPIETVEMIQPEPEMAAPVAEPAVATDTLTITLNADCWMLVQDADGQVLVEGLKGLGFNEVVSGKAPFSLRLGAPEAVSLEFNGDSVDLSSFRAGRVARVTLPQ
ncbi:RodZ domain-containing protein [Ferrimonas pelagia]|uniref:DUF4115 domain-containing protein n=1 Tax=Ferrimonas pelagia TaxID=1177826 RepID=A0ABP9FAY3_9GAMM